MRLWQMEEKLFLHDTVSRLLLLDCCSDTERTAVAAVAKAKAVTAGIININS